MGLRYEAMKYIYNMEHISSLMLHCVLPVFRLTNGSFPCYSYDDRNQYRYIRYHNCYDRNGKKPGVSFIIRPTVAAKTK